MSLITINQFLQIYPAFVDDASTGGLLVSLMNRICPIYGIREQKLFDEFLITCASSSKGFTEKVERIGEKRATELYENRKDLGNTEKGDGWEFRGRGYIKLLGRRAYTEYTNYRQIPLCGALIESIGTSTSYAFDASCWVFAKTRGVLPTRSNQLV